MGVWRYISIHSSPWHHMELSGQHHSVRYFVGKETPVFNELDTGWAPEVSG